MSKRPRMSPQAGVPSRRPRRRMEPVAFPTLEPFARRLESLRLERRLTQRALAERAEISTNAYLDIAHAHANPSVLVLLRLANALGVPLADLFGEPPPAETEHRLVPLSDLRELANTHERLAAVVMRVTDAKRLPRTRSAKRHV